MLNTNGYTGLRYRLRSPSGPSYADNVVLICKIGRSEPAKRNPCGPIAGSIRAAEPEKPHFHGANAEATRRREYAKRNNMPNGKQALPEGRACHQSQGAGT